MDRPETAIPPDSTPDTSRREFLERLRRTAVVAAPVVAVVALQTPRAMAGY